MTGWMHVFRDDKCWNHATHLRPRQPRALPNGFLIVKIGTTNL